MSPTTHFVGDLRGGRLRMLGAFDACAQVGQLGALTSTPTVAVTKDGSQQLVF
jgi:hypothetical protein